MTATPLLRAQSLSLTRGGRDLFHDISIAVLPGELWQIEGANGAGKTSLMRILTGLSRYGYEGAVERACAALYLGHKPAVKGMLTPRENLRMHVSGRLQVSDEAIDEALARVGLLGYENTPCNQLSAGQHRRVNLSRLYLDEAPLWLLDEPFTAIDKQGVKALERRMDEHAAAGGAVVVVSHQTLAVSAQMRTLSLGERVRA